MKNSNNITVRFGQRVRQLRTELGLSQEAFADKCGLDRTYISGIERGVRNPTLEVIAVIADGLGVRLNELFTL
ncbi:helix-turn-helix transcriptional regulator [Kosakonia cowanii]|uniref:helix-turn-helix domain-containing protein n=1 Tax=Kosakonia TaxID=1330547 RepID=UPI0019092AF4|nr:MULTISPECIES: helix-turn-helix transcriptional regulator [Kosakonia]MBK0017375.1 helix-turn-helix transcriptional regulator [Kosakonia sp. S42]UGS47270.1 helix-turn-helix transcriptional regulator [Kosakonia cowanii]